jgi:glycosyl transferase family 87
MDDANRTSGLEHSKGTMIRWPVKLLGPPPGMKEIATVCWAQFIALLLAFFFLFGAQIENQSGLFHDWHCGFIYFYGIGQIAKEYPSVRIYDYSLQQKIFNEIHPAPEGYYGPSPYPPFVALFFSLLARFPFNLAYVLWAAISFTLYIAGIGAALRGVFPGERLKNSLIFCLALEFSPFILYTFANGQLASIAVASVGLAIFQEIHSKPFRSGLALSILTYKPTLLLLLIPMLFLTRRFKTLSGFAAGAAMLIAGATAFTGIQIWPAYVRFMRRIGQVAGLNGHSGLNLSKYIDLSAFSYLIPGGRSEVGLAILISVASMVAACLAVLLWRSATCGSPAHYLAWASTLTWTLLLNVYVPLYDSVLLVIAIVLTLGALKDMKRNTAACWVVFLSVLIFAVAWGTEAFALSHRIQLLSIFLAVLGFGQLFLLHRTIRETSMPIESGLLVK